MSEYMTQEELNARAGVTPGAAPVTPEYISEEELTRKVEAPVSTKPMTAKESQAASDDPWWTDLGEGMAHQIMSTVTGFVELVKDESPTDMIEHTRRLEKESESGWGQVGRGGMEVAELTLPASKMMKAGKLIKGIKPFTRFLGMAGADAASSAGLGALDLPGEGETRGENAASNAAFSALGSGAGRALTRGILPKNKAGNKLIEEGVQLTAGQGGKGAKGAEAVSSVLPPFGRSIQTAKEKSLESFNLAAFKRAAGDRAKEITKTGIEGLAQLRKVGKRDTLRYEVLEEAATKARQNRGVFSPDQLLEADFARGGADAFTNRATPYRDFAQKGKDTIGSQMDLTSQPMGAVRRVAATISPPLPGMGGINRSLVGSTKGQQALRSMQKDPRIEALLKYVRPGTVGAGVED